VTLARSDARNDHRSGFPSASALTQTDQTRRIAGSGRTHFKTTNSHREVPELPGGSASWCVLVRSDGLLLVSRSGVPESPSAHQNSHEDSRLYEGLNIGCVSLEVGIDRAETQGNLKDPRSRRTAVANGELGYEKADRISGTLYPSAGRRAVNSAIAHLEGTRPEVAGYNSRS
jgi:hypothetical protein